MAADTKAIDALTALGLTEYEARCFVALTQLSQGTAKEISRLADVPQSRVYDVTEQLNREGLIDVQDSDPRRYVALPVQEAINRLHREYSSHLEEANDALENLNSRQRDDDGAWTIATREDVIVRCGMHIGDATEDVYLHVARDELLEGEIMDALDDANDRGLSIYVEVPTEALRTKIHNRLPAVNVAVSDLPLETAQADDRSPGRLLMVDRGTILMSAQKEGLVPGKLEETGLWGSNVAHGLVAWLQPLLTARIDQLEFTTAE